MQSNECNYTENVKPYNPIKVITPQLRLSRSAQRTGTCEERPAKQSWQHRAESKPRCLLLHNVSYKKARCLMMQNFLSSLRLQSGVRLDGVLLLSNFSSTRHSYPGLGRVSESNEDWIRYTHHRAPQIPRAAVAARPSIGQCLRGHWMQTTKSVKIEAL